VNQQPFAGIAPRAKAGVVPIGNEDVPSEQRKEEYVEWHRLFIRERSVRPRFSEFKGHGDSGGLADFELADLAPQNVSGSNPGNP
jgi:hypothetical protein